MHERLPLAPLGNATAVLPSQTSLLAAMKLAKDSPEAANYLFQAAKVILQRAKIPTDQSKTLLDELEKFRNNVDMLSLDSSKAWAGEDLPGTRVISEFNNLQNHLAAQAAAQVGKNDIVFDYAISEKADFIRGYSSNKQPLDEKALAGMDALFNAWLAEKQMICQGGGIYEYEVDTTTNEIKPREDRQGQPVRANADKLKNLISSKEDGFATWVKSKTNTDFKITAQEQDYHAPVKTEAGTSAAAPG